MTASINFQPFKTQGAFTDSFNVESRGYVQGDAQDDPSTSLQLCSGQIDPAITSPIWAGMALLECISTVDNNVSGSLIKLATDSTCNVISVANQAHHGITTASNSVPLFVGGGSVHYYRFGSGARVPLPVSAAVAALAASSQIVGVTGFQWDRINNMVDIYSVADPTNYQPFLNIKLLQISQHGNLTVKKQADGNMVWATDKPCGLFLI